MRSIIVTAAILYAAPLARDHMDRALAFAPVPQPTSTGLASWYGPGFDGRLTASGAVFHADDLTAAHRTFPFGTIVVVRDVESGRTVEVTINDRGPFTGNRLIDLSQGAAQELGMTDKGVTHVAIFVKEARL
jgi:rare lipoprotein A